MELTVRIRRVENGYYVRVFKGFFEIRQTRFVATDLKILNEKLTETLEALEGLEA